MERLGDDWEGTMNLSKFPIVELTWVDTRPFYLSVALVNVNVGHVYFACVQRRSNRIPIKGVSLASPFTHRPRYALSTLSLLLASGSLYRCRSHPDHRIRLVDGKSLQ